MFVNTNLFLLLDASRTEEDYSEPRKKNRELSWNLHRALLVFQTGRLYFFGFVFYFFECTESKLFLCKLMCAFPPFDLGNNSLLVRTRLRELPEGVKGNMMLGALSKDLPKATPFLRFGCISALVKYKILLIFSPQIRILLDFWTCSELLYCLDSVSRSLLNGMNACVIQDLWSIFLWIFKGNQAKI